MLHFNVQSLYVQTLLQYIRIKMIFDSTSKLRDSVKEIALKKVKLNLPTIHQREMVQIEVFILHIKM